MLLTKIPRASAATSYTDLLITSMIAPFSAKLIFSGITIHLIKGPSVPRLRPISILYDLRHMVFPEFKFMVLFEFKY